MYFKLVLQNYIIGELKRLESVTKFRVSQVNKCFIVSAGGHEYYYSTNDWHVVELGGAE